MTDTTHRSTRAVLPATLNLGCGDDYRDDAHNVDVSEAVAADEYHDLSETPWPWPDNAYQHVLALHVLEHLPTVPWTEVQRVLTPTGRLTLRYPIGHTRFEDPTHEQFWNYWTADVLAGDRKHAHETPLDVTLVDKTVDWQLSHADTLTRAYVWWRRWASGDGPWLEQVPGVFGEVTAVYRGEP